MQRVIVGFVVVLGLSLPATLETRATEPTDSSIATAAPEQTNAPPRVSLTTMTEAGAEKLSPMMREMRAALLREQADVGILTHRLAEVDDRLSALDIQRDISDRKFRTQIDLLEVQSRFARLEGRIQQAEEAESAVARMKTKLESLQEDRRKQ